ncbi:MAG: thioredoxin domain-containing protein [Leptospiraceae bacterium]|nr:thioredoxin domain-containing protein [Leptospiraceae bacterium]
MKDSNKKSNHLINEKSPYLLQHAYNPVDWYPWCDDALQKAEKEDKMIFLSIGYATCHWCHVMERESFEDINVADFLNQHYVSIKVDREERPDIDKIYMDALHLMGQSGGWPLNMFLTPKQKPITGGTYFPPLAKYGRNSFMSVLKIIQDSWTEQKEEILKASDDLTFHLGNIHYAPKNFNLPSTKSFENAFIFYKNYFDEEFYGFRFNENNKFPPSLGLSYLMFFYKIYKKEKALDMVKKTLIAMKKGGIYDQLGGGLCRYSTDRFWLAPHFEKMLYDNSLFVISLCECYKITRDEFFKEAAIDVVTYVLRDLKLETGGIASAEDADSEGEEGKFYLWGIDEFREVCYTDSSLLEKFWDVTISGNFERKNILHEEFGKDFVKENNLNPKEWKEILQTNKNKLLEYRSKRIRPLRDDKVLTSWNCLFVRALIEAGIAFDKSEFIEEAIQNYNFIYQNMFDLEHRLYRRYRDGERKHKAYLVDYAELALVSIWLYRATFEVPYLKNAISLTDDIVRLFKSDQGTFYDTAYDSEQLISKTIEGYDGVEPSGNSTVSYVLNYLKSYSIKPDEYESYLLPIYKYFSEGLEGQSIHHTVMLSSYLFFTSAKKEVVVIGDKSSQKVKDVIHYLNSSYLPNVVVAVSDLEDLDESSKVIPLFYNRRSDKDLVIYVCKEGACELPIYTLDDLKKSLVGLL